MMDYRDKILFGDALDQLKTIPDETVQMCVTSPPYWGLRDYGVEGQLGLEETPEEYVDNLTAVFNEVKRVLKEDGTLWLNIGDSYAGGGRGGDPKHKKGDNSSENTMESYKGIPAKNLLGMPWRVAFSLQSEGWYLRSEIIWNKPNCMPESVTDRPTNAHEKVFLLSKSKRYYYDWESIAEEFKSDDRRPRNKGAENYGKNGYVGDKPLISEGKRDWFKQGKKNKRSVWNIYTQSFPEAHFAVYPPELIAPCIKAGSKPYDIVLDPFFGSGTTGEVCKKLNRHYLGIELNEDYGTIQQKRLQQNTLQFQEL